MFKRVFSFSTKGCVGGLRMYPPGFAVYITLGLTSFADAHHNAPESLRMIGLICLSLFSGVFMSGYVRSSWAHGVLNLSSDAYLAVGGMLAMAALAVAGVWQSRKGKPLPWGLSQGGYLAAIALPYVVGLGGGFLL